MMEPLISKKVANTMATSMSKEVKKSPVIGVPQKNKKLIDFESLF